MMSGHVKIGVNVGNGAALNIELGFVPTYVEVFNATDGTRITCAFLQWVVPFSSGGTTEITVGSRIKGATTGATATVESVLLYSGTWAGGDAAGFFVVQEGTLVGTFGSENVYKDDDNVTGIDDATVTVNVVHNVGISDTGVGTTDLAPATTTSAISRLEGTAGTSGKGFTIGSVLAVEAKVLRYIAFQGD